MNRVEESWVKEAELRAKSGDQVSYQSWFDTVSTVDVSVGDGHIDFFHRILTPKMYPYLGDPRGKTCVEIGFGGGRLLCASSSVFRHAYGIDILGPKARAMTKSFLEQNGRKNVTLFHRDEDASFVADFAYSFIVMQHLSKVDAIDYYIEKLDRLMGPQGCGIIFFGKHPEDKEFEFMESKFDENVRACTLLVSPDYAKSRVARKFKVVDCQPAGKKKVWSSNGVSGQFYVSFAGKVT